MKTIIVLAAKITDYSKLLGIKWVFKHQDFKMFGLKLYKYSSFHPLEVVGRGSETQLQVVENLTKRFKC